MGDESLSSTLTSRLAISKASADTAEEVVVFEGDRGIVSLVSVHASWYNIESVFSVS